MAEDEAWYQMMLYKTIILTDTPPLSPLSPHLHSHERGLLRAVFKSPLRRGRCEQGRGDFPPQADAPVVQGVC